MSERKRLSFAEGYLNFDFNNVIYSDEATIFAGPHGQVDHSFILSFIDSLNVCMFVSV